MSKRIAIGFDSGGNHISSSACYIERKKYLPENQSQKDLSIQGTIDEIISIWSQT
jgi:hypothetical protein